MPGGSNGVLSSRFAALRLRPASRDWKRSEPYAEEWLLIEWPLSEPKPTKYWLSTLPADTPIKMLDETAKLRWRIERDYQDLKQELGLGHYEDRSWRGFHHHASLCIAAYGFMVTRRETFPPQRRLNPLQAKRLAFPQITDPADPPIRTERHVPTSITSIRRSLAFILGQTRPRCPYCARAMLIPRHRSL